MVARNAADTAPAYPSPGAVLALLKPITWFPPMWAYACGVISAGSAIEDRSLHIIGGILLAGPLICGASQAVNDWFDRHVDAINEPWRVIPSGRMPGRWGLWIAIINSLLSLAVAALLGTYVFYRRDHRHRAGMGLQHAARAPQGEWLVRQRGRRHFVRNAALAHCCGRGARRGPVHAGVHRGAGLRHRSARHHDA